MAKGEGNYTTQNLIFLLLGISSVVFIYNTFCDVWVPAFPDSGKRFGHNSTIEVDEGVHPFQIKIKKNVLNDLKMRLELELERMKDVDYKFKNLTTYWLRDYDWKGVREKVLNKYPQFRTKIFGRFVHFQHIKPKMDVSNPSLRKIRPLLLLHGIQNTMAEFQNIIPYLMQAEDSEIGFELIIPSIPGSGYSEGRLGKPYTDMEIAEVFLKLMERVGHDKFYVHGALGLGSKIAANLAAIYPHNVVGIHLSTCETNHPLAFVRDLPWSVLSTVLTIDTKPLHRLEHFYFQKPKETEIVDGMGDVVCNSPTVLATHLLGERTGNDFEYDNSDWFLDNVMMHWLGCSSVSSSICTQNCEQNGEQFEFSMDRVPIFVPTSCTRIQSTNNEYYPQSRFVIGDKFRQIIHFTEMEHSGKFPALEIPEVMAKDVIGSFNWLEKRGFAFYEEYHRCQILPYE